MPSLVVCNAFQALAQSTHRRRRHIQYRQNTRIGNKQVLLLVKTIDVSYVPYDALVMALPSTWVELALPLLLPHHYRSVVVEVIKLTLSFLISTQVELRPLWKCDWLDVEAVETLKWIVVVAKQVQSFRHLLWDNASPLMLKCLK